MKALEKSSLWSLPCAATLGSGDAASAQRVDTGQVETTALRDVNRAESVSACQKVRRAVIPFVG